MVDHRTAAQTDTADNRNALLRRLSGRAHQLRAAMRAADHFVTLGIQEDRDTGAWLMSAAVAIAEDVTTEVDGTARALRQGPADADFSQLVQQLRVRAHQLHAAARAADHFLELESPSDADTGTWLIAFARGLAERLAGELDDALGHAMRLPARRVAEDHDPALQRRLKAAVSLPAGADD